MEGNVRRLEVDWNIPSFCIHHEARSLTCQRRICIEGAGLAEPDGDYVSNHVLDASLPFCCVCHTGDDSGFLNLNLLVLEHGANFRGVLSRRFLSIDGPVLLLRSFGHGAGMLLPLRPYGTICAIHGGGVEVTDRGCAGSEGGRGVRKGGREGREGVFQSAGNSIGGWKREGRREARRFRGCDSLREARQRVVSQSRIEGSIHPAWMSEHQGERVEGVSKGE